jgi:hypothetical protein
MKSIGQWILTNPNAFKAFMLIVVAWIGAFIVAATGKPVSPAWNDVINGGADLLAVMATIIGASSGVVHTLRGPDPKPIDQAATIVAAIQGPPVSQAVSQVAAAQAAVLETPK